MRAEGAERDPRGGQRRPQSEQKLGTQDDFFFFVRCGRVLP
jgi:hypothetical protein